MRRKKIIKRNAYKKIVEAKNLLSQILEEGWQNFLPTDSDLETELEEFELFCSSLLRSLRATNTTIPMLSAMVTVLEQGALCDNNGRVTFFMPSTSECCKAYKRTQRSVRHGEMLRLHVYTDESEYYSDWYSDVPF